MRRLTRTAAALALLSMMSVAAWALAQGAAPKDDRTVTMELMRQIMPAAAYDATVEQMYKQMSATMQQMGGAPLPADKLKALREAVKEVLPYEDLVKWSTDVYMKHLTRKQIEDLAAFYGTPSGKKIAEKLPQMAGEIGALMAPMMMGRLPAALKKRGVSI